MNENDPSLTAAGRAYLRQLKTEALLIGVPLDVLRHFERYAWDLWHAGRKDYSARTIIERIRWHEHVERGNAEFKINDHCSPKLSRYMIAKYPCFDGFFELRVTNEERAAREAAAGIDPRDGK